MSARGLLFLVSALLMVSNTAIQAERFIKPRKYRHPSGRVMSKKIERHTLSTMTLDELHKSKTAALKRDDKEAAIRYLERMLKLVNDVDLAGKWFIELADLYFDTGQVTKAEQFYARFCALYQGHELAEYAHYKNIAAARASVHTIDRDQTKTEQVVALADGFLARSVYTTYRPQVEKIRAECCQRLFESEQSICQFYINNKRFAAAQQRCNLIRDELQEKDPALEPQLLALSRDVAQACGDMQGYMQHKNDLIAKYPQYETMQLAQNKPFRFTDLF